VPLDLPFMVELMDTLFTVVCTCKTLDGGVCCRKGQGQEYDPP
jgi:hypothetical protein